DRSGSRCKKDLTGEGRRSAWLDRAAVGSNRRRVDEIGAIARETQLEQIVQLRLRHIRGYRVVGRLSGTVERPVLRQDREGNSRLPRKHAADLPPPQDAIQRLVADAMTVTSRDLINEIPFDHMRQVECRTRFFEFRIVVIL